MRPATRQRMSPATRQQSRIDPKSDAMNEPTHTRAVARGTTRELRREGPLPPSGFDVTAHLRRLCGDLVGRLPPLHHIQLDHVAFAFAQARKPTDHGLYASLTPLRFEGGVLVGMVSPSSPVLPRGCVLRCCLPEEAAPVPRSFSCLQCAVIVGKRHDLALMRWLQIGNDTDDELRLGNPLPAMDCRWTTTCRGASRWRLISSPQKRFS